MAVGRKLGSMKYVMQQSKTPVARQISSTICKVPGPRKSDADQAVKRRNEQALDNVY